MTDSDTKAALRRAGKRAAFHLVKAAVEGLKAIEAIVDELAAVGRDEQKKPDASGPVHIDIEG